MNAPSAPRIRRPLPVLLTLLLTAIAVLLPALPASAHDQLLSSDPAAGASLDALPAEVRLSFSAALLSDAGSTVVQVTDEAGTLLSAGDPQVDQNVVTQPLSGDAAGTVTVEWRVVSSDGHPISETFTFTVTGAAAPSPTASAPESAAPSPTPEPSETPLVTAEVDDDAQSPLPWIIGGVVMLGALGAVIALLGARARQGRTAGSGRGAGRSDPDER